MTKLAAFSLWKVIIMASVSGIAALLSTMAMSQSWVKVPTDDARSFDPDCIYQVQLDDFSHWYTAAAANPQSLLFTPYGSIEDVNEYSLILESDSKNTLLLKKSSGDVEKINLGFEDIRMWCPGATNDIPLDRNTTFAGDCLHRVHESGGYFNFLTTGFSSESLELLPHDYGSSSSSVQADISYKTKNQTEIKTVSGQRSLHKVDNISRQCIKNVWNSEPDTGSFKTQCIYRVLLDSDPYNWQLAFGIDTNGFTLYVNNFVPQGVTGTQKTIGFTSKGKYTRTRAGESDQNGIVRAIQYICPPGNKRSYE